VLTVQTLGYTIWESSELQKNTHRSRGAGALLYSLAHPAARSLLGQYLSSSITWGAAQRRSGGAAEARRWRPAPCPGGAAAGGVPTLGGGGARGRGVRSGTVRL